MKFNTKGAMYSMVTLDGKMLWSMQHRDGHGQCHGAVGLNALRARNVVTFISTPLYSDKNIKVTIF